MCRRCGARLWPGAFQCWFKSLTMAATLSFYTTASGIERARVSILSCGTNVLLYTIPSFPVVQVRLRQIRFKLMKPDGSSIHKDGFIKDDPSLNCIYPAELPVAMPTGYNFDASFVLVSCIWFIIYEVSLVACIQSSLEQARKLSQKIAHSNDNSNLRYWHHLIAYFMILTSSFLLYV